MKRSLAPPRIVTPPYEKSHQIREKSLSPCSPSPLAVFDPRPQRPAFGGAT